MDSEQLLALLEANREPIKARNNTGLDDFEELKAKYAGEADDDCLLSMALTEGIVEVNFRSDYSAAIRHSLDALGRYPGGRYAAYQVRHLGLIGQSYSHIGDTAQARLYLDRAWAMAKAELDNSDAAIAIRADLLNDMAMTNEKAKGDPAESIRLLERSYALLEGSPWEVRRAACRVGLGNVLLEQGRYEEALRYYTDAEVFLRRLQNLLGLSYVINNIGLCHIYLHQPELAESFLIRALHLRLKLGHNDAVKRGYLNLAQLYEETGDEDKQYQMLLDSLDYTSSDTDRSLHTFSLKKLELLAAKRNDTGAAAAFHMQWAEVSGVDA